MFDTRYWDFTVKHFHEKLLDEHGFTRSYNWVRLTLQAHGRKRPAPRRGAHRRKRPRRALPAMMLHQDGSTHQWVPGQWWDLIVTMDDATSEIYSAFFVDEEGTMSSFRALGEVIEVRGLFCSLYADRASHYWHTPEAGGKVDKNNPTQVGRALGQLGIELIPAYSPEARGRSERMFATLQNRLPQELRLAAITTMAEANAFLREIYLPRHNARFAVPAEAEGSAFVPFTGSLDDILCIQEDRIVGNDNTVRYKRLVLQIPEDRHRRHYVKASVRVHEYSGGTLAVFHGPRRLARYQADGTVLDETKNSRAPREPLRRAPGLWISGQPATAGSPLIHRPNNHNRSGIWHKAVNSKCSRQFSNVRPAGFSPLAAARGLVRPRHAHRECGGMECLPTGSCSSQRIPLDQEQCLHRRGALDRPTAASLGEIVDRAPGGSTCSRSIPRKIFGLRGRCQARS